MTFKTAAKKAGNGLMTGLTVVANAQTQTRINEIDSEIEALQEQIDQLNEERTNLTSRII